MKSVLSQIGLPIIDVDFDTMGFQENLYELYAGWQKHNPIFENTAGVIYLTKYEDCLKLLSSSDFVRQTELGSPFRQSGEITELESLISNWMVYQDSPKHARLRQSAAKYFTPKNIKELEFVAESVSKRLIAAFEVDDQLDFIQSFAFSLPIEIICQMLGVTSADKLMFMHWSIAISEGLNSGEPVEMQASAEAIYELRQYFRPLLELRRELSSDDLISVLLRSDLSDEEVIDSCIFLIWAGHETTKLTLASSLKLLADFPDIWSQLKVEPELIPNAVEEAIRMESPVQKLSRWSCRETSFSGVVIPPGRQVVALIGAANRDPAAFESPAQFNLRRAANKHLGFGKGVHHCLGISLARMEAKVALRSLLDTVEDYSVSEYAYRPLSAFRSLEQLNIKLNVTL